MSIKSSFTRENRIPCIRSDAFNMGPLGRDWQTFGSIFLRIFRTVTERVGFPSTRSTNSACVGCQNWTSDVPFSVLYLMRRVNGFGFTILVAKHTEILSISRWLSDVGALCLIVLFSCMSSHTPSVVFKFDSIDLNF